ncbi:TPA: condensation domain-containing protein, partial [Pseudomonas aeruginosa]
MMAEIRRPLSAVERWYWLSDQFSALNVISRVRVHGQLSIDDLRRGLDALQARHPLLRARIEHDAGFDPRWVPCERPIPLREVRGGGEEQWLREINERELPERIDPDSGPLIRTVAITTDAGAHDLLVVVPHIIADGTTVLTLAEQWLALAADPAAQPWTASALPPAEDLRPRRFTGDEGAARLAEQTAQDEA